MKLSLLEDYLVKTGEDKLYFNTLTESDKKILSKKMVSRLVKSIKEKSLKIDYYGIENTKGDITKFKKYKDLENSIQILHRMYQADPSNSPSEILTLVKTLDSIKKNKTNYMKCFAENNQIIILLYTNIVAVLISATSNIILTTLDYIKSPMGNYKKVFKAESERKLKHKIYFKSLERYLLMDKTGDLRTAFNSSQAVHENFDFDAKGEYLTEFAPIVIGVVLGLMGICIFIREIVFLFYFERKKIANELLSLAYFLEEHAYELDTSTKDGKKIFEKQLNVVEKLRKLADFIGVKDENAIKETQEAIKKDDEENREESKQNNNEDTNDNDDILL